MKGNKVTLLIDGPATYAAMFKAVENAKNHINILSRRFAAEMERMFAGALEESGEIKWAEWKKRPLFSG